MKYIFVIHSTEEQKLMKQKVICETKTKKKTKINETSQ